jgi:putative spermidine/putrescine transport system ATP-binding protein
VTVGLEIRQLSKSFGVQRVVDDVSLSVQDGEFVCFLGPSGCGKTTLLRMIAGLEAPSAGRILMNGRDITEQAAHERNFAMVFQALALFPFLTVAENIAYSLRFRAMNAQQRHETVQALLQLVQLPGIGQRSVHQLSGGQRQRVAIARALAQEPVLFLLDEPLSALDARLRDHMQVELRQLQRKLRVTTILVTHDQREAMTLADTVIVMADGQIQQIGTPTQIYRAPANRFVAQFIGRSNLLETRVEDAAHVRVGATMIQVTVPPSARRGDQVTLSVRPEDLRLHASRAGVANALPGRIIFVRDVGDEIELRVACEDGELIACLLPSVWERLREDLESTDEVALQLPGERCCVLTC